MVAGHAMRTMLLLSAAAVMLVGSGARAQGPATLKGDWEGLLKVSDAAELRLVVHVDGPKDGALSATFDSPDQGATGLKVDAIAIDKDRVVTFAMKRIAAEYKGTMNEAGTEIAGEWKQAGKAFPLTFTRADKGAAAAEVWEGKLKVAAGIELRLVVRATKQKDGSYRATFDSPDQGATGLKVDSFSKEDGTLKFAMKSLKGEFSGKLNAAGIEAVGQWKQAGMTFPLTLKRVEKVTEYRRPQTPRGPFPYRQEAVAYENKAGGVTLAGTLTVPRGDGPFPAAVLISGSGAQDRDETLLGHKPFLVLADDLTRRGIAVLRVDDRGVGGSTGKTIESTSEDFAGDVLAGVAFLKGRKEIDPKRIGLIGHSEGGIIAPMVAARSDDIAFIVMMAGTGLPGEEILTLQRTAISRASGLKDEQIKAINETSARLLAVAKAEKDPKVAVEKMRALAKEVVAKLPEDERKDLGGLDAQVEMVATPWFRAFLAYDPRPALAKVRCPVLAINGEKDLQVPPGENLGEIEKALKAAGNARVTIKELPGLNHLFQPCRTGAPSEYAAIEETIAPEALRVIGDWIAEQVGRK
jgi:uncharacterized protein